MYVSMNIDVYHNILWSAYKGQVLKEFQIEGKIKGLNINVFQIAETEKIRLSLGNTYKDSNDYSYELMFDGCYEDISKARLIIKLFKNIYNSRSEVIILPGYHLIEHWFMLVLSKLLRKKVYVFCDSTSYDNSRTVCREYLKKTFFSIINGVFAYGTKSMLYVNSYGVDKKNIFYPVSSAINNGKNISINTITQQRQALYDNKEKTFLFVGRLSSEKSLEELVVSWKSITAKIDGLYLKIAGDGAMMPVLQEKVELLGLSSSVEFLGSVDQVRLAELYSESFALILPSKSEPWGLVVNESYFYGCPAIVSSNCGCSPDLIIDSEMQSIDPFELKNLENNITKLLRCSEKYINLSVSCKTLIDQYTPKNAAYTMLKAFEDKNT